MPLAAAPLPCGLEDASLPAEEDAPEVPPCHSSGGEWLKLSDSLTTPTDPDIVDQFKMVWDHDQFRGRAMFREFDFLGKSHAQ